jgi:DNA-binding NarL/FixJ family response regulator
MPLQPSDDAPVRVLLVDDQTLLRQGFQRLLELGDNRVEVVGAASDGVEALALIERLERENRLPQVVLMDIRMPRMDGVQATAQIRARWPAVRILMLTTFDNDEYVFDGLRAGASGYMLKDASAEELVAAIHAASRGESPLQPSIAAKLVARLRAESPAGSASTATSGMNQGAEMAELTEREREILRYLARGASNREIGEALYITEGTVKNHVSNILNKLALRDRTQAALWAREHSLV